jgi:hypothetical protein
LVTEVLPALAQDEQATRGGDAAGAGGVGSVDVQGSRAVQRGVLCEFAELLVRADRADDAATVCGTALSFFVPELVLIENLIGIWWEQ